MFRALLISVFLVTALITSSLEGGAPLKFPVVLVHGLLSGDSISSMKNVANFLRQQGQDVYLVELLAAGSIAERAQDLAKGIDEILKASHADKVNLVAHSMGGLDSRYVISKLGFGPKIASLTTVSSPHRGAIMADQVLQELKAGRRSGLIRVLEVLSVFYNGATRFDNVDLEAALFDLSKPQMKKFNLQVLNDPQVLYFSFNSIASQDVMHNVLKPISEIISEREGPNDGLVEASSAEWGEFLGTANCDHFTMGGMGRPKILRKCDYKSFYSNITKVLFNRGF